MCDLDDSDFDDLLNAPAKPEVKISQPGFEENCPKCRGTGVFVSYSGRSLGNCFHCKGKGKLVFKTSAVQRQQTREKAAARKREQGQQALDSFAQNHPAVWEWISTSRMTFGFANSMYMAIEKYGSLTENQLAACERAVAKRLAAKEAAQARVDNAVTIDMSQIEIAFAKASQKLKSPRLRIGSLMLSPAKATSKNAGSIYVKQDGIYLGKITASKFIRSRDCSDEQEKVLIDTAHDPKEAAIRHGRLTGQCACCGRLLTVKESIERGIGPICAEQFGW